MKYNLLWLVFVCLITLPFLSNAQPIELQKDYTGSTQYLSPKGWTISTDQQNGVYTWLTTKDANDENAPAIMVLAAGNAAGAPKDYLMQLLNPYFQNLKETGSKLLSNDEGHMLFDGESSGNQAKIAAVFVRDANSGMMFLSCFAASPNAYRSLGGEELLYRCLNRPNPYGQSANSSSNAKVSKTSSGIVTDPVAEQFGNGMNMQSQEVQRQILNNSATFSVKDLHGEWTQVMSAMTGNVYEEVGSGKLTYGSSGYAHLLKLFSNGKYELIYSYRSGPQNVADFVEKGTYTLGGNILKLVASNYSGNFLVYGKSQAQNVNKPGIRQFQVGMHNSGKYAVLLGKPFEYTISTDTDPNGNPVFQEGFYRTQ
ncbi:MAG: hypothetical protein AAFO07_10970 [Bacteroidota bacterium]